MIIAALAASPALAGDLAWREVIGFSPSGSHFAFEEYGIQDGSGFPYANVYIVDTRTDSWVAGTPVRIVDEQDGASLHEARDRAMEEAGPVLDQTRITETGNHVASNPAGELSADPHAVTVNTRHTVRPIDGEVEIVLEEFPLDGAEICADWGQTKGYSLALRRHGERRELHRDEAIPESRGCALTYRIGDVFTHFPPDSPPVIAVLVFYEKVGFEGPDGRWLAVTAPLENGGK